jgi:hypothetical protein
VENDVPEGYVLGTGFLHLMVLGWVAFGPVLRQIGALLRLFIDNYIWMEGIRGRRPVAWGLFLGLIGLADGFILGSLVG